MKIKNAILTGIPVLLALVSISTHKINAQTTTDTTSEKPFTITRINDKTYDKVDFNEVSLETEDLSVTGTAPAGSLINVTYDGIQNTITTDQEGVWEFKKTLPKSSYAVNFSYDDNVYGVLIHTGQADGSLAPAVDASNTSPNTVEISSTQPLSAVVKNMATLLGISVFAITTLLILKKLHRNKSAQTPQEPKVDEQL